MDRIKAALDKSRKRKRRRGAPKPLPEQPPAVDSGQPFDEIEYSDSRNIDVSQRLLLENRLIAGNRSDPRGTAFRMLRTQILHAMRENNWTTLAVTGPTSGIGKSLVASNLALSISFEVNQTVLLADLDLRRPAVHKYFNFEPEYGLLDFLRGETELKKLFVSPMFKRLILLPGRGTTAESSEMLSSPRMMDLLYELKTRYESRIIIFDMPPLLNIEDALVFLPNVDACLLVVENGKNTLSDVHNSMRLLQGSNLIGTVLNKADEEIHDYY